MTDYSYLSCIFPGHTDPDCHKNFNPYDVKQLNDVNTVICEQSFHTLNKFKNVKSMNYARFELFFLYFIDLLNLDKEGKLSSINPKLQEKERHCNTDEGHNVTKKSPEKKVSPLESLETQMSELKLESKGHLCQKCMKTFSSKSGLTRHSRAIHLDMQDDTEKCPKCDKVFNEKKSLNRHLKNSKTCS